MRSNYHPVRRYNDNRAKGRERVKEVLYCILAIACFILAMLGESLCDWVCRAIWGM